MLYVIKMGDKENTPTKRFDRVLAMALKGKKYEWIEEPEDFISWSTRPFSDRR